MNRISQDLTSSAIESSIYTFACESNRTSKMPLKPRAIFLNLDTDEKSCRICLETDEINNHFIHPCKCSGSIKHVHEKCLKQWLITLGKDLELSKCELCNTKFSMSFKLTRRCLPKESFKNNNGHCLFIPILLIVISMLFLIVYLLTQKYLSNNISNNQKAYTIVIIILCLSAEIAMVCLLIKSIREACYSSKLEDWKILSQTFIEENSSEINE